jgi:Tfp pilus assembly protein PilW
VITVTAVLLTAFTAFYLSQQRAVRHHQVEVETSQALRTALEQISRDLRSARKDITWDFHASPPSGGAQPTFLTANASAVEFELDANDDGAITATDPAEHKGYQRNASASTIEQYDAPSGTWATLADYVSAFTLTYQYCPGAPVNPDNIKSIDILIQVSRPVVGGLPVVRTETESVELRNVRCP